MSAVRGKGEPRPWRGEECCRLAWGERVAETAGREALEGKGGPGKRSCLGHSFGLALAKPSAIPSRPANPFPFPSSSNSRRVFLDRSPFPAACRQSLCGSRQPIERRTSGMGWDGWDGNAWPETGWGCADADEWMPKERNSRPF